MKLLILTKRSLISIGFCFLIGALAATVAITSTVKAVQTAAQPKENPIYRVESHDNRIAISFDAAWGDEQTEQLLDILDENNVKATFFLVGDWVDKYPDDVKEIAQRGHDIGNHSDTHPHLPQLSNESLQQRPCQNGQKPRHVLHPMGRRFIGLEGSDARANVQNRAG
nr:polysaccharide deacetylase family protein [uncultured Ruminococcus sp.]